MVLILGVSVGISAQRICKNYMQAKKKSTHDNLITLYKDISGQRSHCNLARTIEKRLPSIFDFECVCILSFKDGELYRLSKLAEDSEELIKHLASIPFELGLTGKCIREGRIVVSSYGSKDPLFNCYVDNVVNTKQFENVVVVPLISGNIVKKFNKDTHSLVGVLQFINYKANVKHLNTVL
jgi:transcriptional regulator with GAF, ATPase, and Fis domain